MIIMGIDPGTATTGFGIIKSIGQKVEHIDHGVFLTSKDKEQEIRLKEIYKSLNSLIKKHKPDFLIVEKLFFFKNLKTALPVSEARGVILLAGSNNNIPITHLTPLQVKMGIVGYGRADKKQVQEMVKRVLKLDKIPKPDDAADALAIAICATNIVKK